MAPGKFNLMWHNNFTPEGVTTPAFPGALVADKALNGVPEWAYGVTAWFEAGLSIPPPRIRKGGGPTGRMGNRGQPHLLFARPPSAQWGFVSRARFWGGDAA